MEDFENNEIRVANYFDNRMSPAEEEAFMHELGDNEELRRQYEDELGTRSLLRSGEDQDEKGSMAGDDLLLQPADEHIDLLRTALERQTVDSSGQPVRTGRAAPVRSLAIRYRLVAVILLGIIGATLLYLFAIRKPHAAPAMVKRPAIGKNVLPDSSRPPLIAKGIPDTPRQAFVQHDTVTQKKRELYDRSPGQLFARLYTAYSGADDPVQVSRYYQYYKQANYEKLFAATDASVREMGSDDSEGLSVAYLHLYQGLGYLADQQPENASSEFEQALQKAGPATAPYYAAQWYACLTWLKRNDRDKAGILARAILQTASSYKAQAAQLLKDLE